MIEGVVQELFYNRHDDLDGWKLHDGTLVHFPPHVGHELEKWIRQGATVWIEGEIRRNREGEHVMHPSYIESQGWSLTLDEPEHRYPNERHDKPPRKLSDRDVTNEDILRELKEIRRMLESWNE